MLTIFQIILATIIALFGLLMLGEENEKIMQSYGMVTCSAIVAMSVTFLF
ncbi:hypothetical protein ACE106_15165 [Shouchella clausii]|nr:hypothetical protein [Shouchella clausii]